MAFVDPTLARKKKTTKPSLWRRTKKRVGKIIKNPRLLLLITAGGAAVVVIGAAATYIYFSNSLATPESIINRKNSGLIFYDKDGQEFYRTAGARDTTIIRLDDISDILEQATIAIEDHSFYDHRGFSLNGYMRAIVTNIKLGDATASGGSTITQQLVKNALLTQDKNYLRKFQELVLSIEIDRRYSKEQILELYLTSTYYGAGAYGIEEAAKTYFNVAASDLTLAQASMLAGLPQAPSAYSPIDGDLELAGQRQRQVLRAMVTNGYITQTEMDQAAQEELSYSGATSPTIASQAPHFVEYVTKQLVDKYGEDKIYRSGYRVYTTIDINLQKQAQQAVAQQVAALSYTGANNGAVVAIHPDSGQLLAMVGSANYNNDDIGGKFNVATANTRQPGSATKPFAYLAAFSQGYTPATILHDKLTDFGGGYTPQNADRRFRGDVTVRRALANSLNIPAVETVKDIGVGPFINTLERAGVKNLNQQSINNCGLAVVLGCTEMPLLQLTQAYATLADEGQYHQLVSYTKIIDKNGSQVYPTKALGIFETGSSVGERVLDRDQVYLITNILADNNARSEVFGSNSPLRLSRPAAVKTGTTDEAKDAWTFGFTPQLAVGVWVGNTASTPMSAAGATAAAPIWNKIMENYHRGLPVENFNRPSNIVELPICNGREAVADQPGQDTHMEIFIRQNQPRQRCTATPTPTPTPEESTPSATPTIAPTPTPSPTPTPTPSPTPIITPTPTPIGPSIVIPSITL